ncbi:tbc1 domain family protein [Cryptococcus deuterogattii CA1014]|nr:tbc1 domain family protein [Cryptococcus deuterogattii CA1014]
MSSFGPVSKDAEDWEDAWDSSSDKEDGGEPSGVPMPMPRGTGKGRDDGDGIAASWTSTSYSHVAYPNSSPTRPALPQSKTFTEGVAPPAPGTSATDCALRPYDHGHTGGSRLPPGGAWEIVEPEEIIEEEQELVKTGKEAVRVDVENILRDPLELLHSLSLDSPAISRASSRSSSFPFFASNDHLSSAPASPSYTPTTPTMATTTKSRKDGVGRQRSVRTERRREKFAKVLRGDEGGVDVGELRRLAWSGVPMEVRPIVWQLLLPRLTTLNRKRKEYTQLVDRYFGRGFASLDQQTQRSLERILYVWAIRHPASGYVQGINDLVTPFFEVFLSAYIDTDPESFDISYLPESVLSAIESDSFWCLTALLNGIQDNYISQQPGIQRLVKRMSELIKRIDAPLATHFEEQGVEFMQFAFRWMNCLLMREISVKCTIRMWDTYLAEGTDAFSQFHLYVCSALLVKYSDRLREMDFQEIIIFLQRLPTQNWGDHDIELLLSEAYVLKTVWQGAENHFKDLPPGGGGFGMLGR